MNQGAPGQWAVLAKQWLDNSLVWVITQGVRKFIEEPAGRWRRPWGGPWPLPWLILKSPLFGILALPSPPALGRSCPPPSDEGVQRLPDRSAAGYTGWVVWVKGSKPQQVSFFSCGKCCGSAHWTFNLFIYTKVNLIEFNRMDFRIKHLLSNGNGSCTWHAQYSMKPLGDEYIILRQFLTSVLHWGPQNLNCWQGLDSGIWARQYGEQKGTSLQLESWRFLWGKKITPNLVHHTLVVCFMSDGQKPIRL